MDKATKHHQRDLLYWEGFVQGNQQALGSLFRLYYPDLFRYGHKIVPEPAVLEDCIQELFIELWQQKNPAPELSVKAYLLRAMKYKLLKILRKKNNTLLQENIETQGVFEISHEDFLISGQENAEQSRRVIQAFSQLSNRQQEIVYLRFYQGLGYEEISAIMNINYQVARNLLHQAIKALKKILLRRYCLFPFLA
ncbi:MAG: sigma-70 family RNA polymerase sigma factor [Candidatus Pseudobacter hemicellulosilyticus]|uniref:Sigma-70 family RNA polymerase sigma factor n=1 Tax=Candidatus Pseudobacter hemicellulosilyticus TaxID=3121375 RepID=A0AAJ6BEZ3_9BACT|nr:MAG: sigma-70 family RNA polymerase sigma factor [Pseudobacter sp.]